MPYSSKAEVFFMVIVVILWLSCVFMFGMSYGYNMGIKANTNIFETELQKVSHCETEIQIYNPTPIPTPTSTPTPTPTVCPTIAPIQSPVELDVKEVEELAKMLYGEARGVTDDVQVAKCAWVALNRVDCEYYPDDLISVLSQSGQFHGYKVDYPVTDRMYNIAEDVLTRYQLEKQGIEVIRELESDYLYFHGDGVNNHFKKSI